MLGRLETTPTQNAKVKEAVDELRRELEALRPEGRRSREELAGLLRRVTFDEVLLGEMFARHDDLLLKGRKALVGFLAKLHDVLDETQRERLATLLEQGPRFSRHFGW